MQKPLRQVDVILGPGGATRIIRSREQGARIQGSGKFLHTTTHSAHPSPQIHKTQHPTLEHKSGTCFSIRRSSHITTNSPRWHPHSATRSPHCGLSQPEGRNMRRHGGEKMVEHCESRSFSTPAMSHSPFLCATTHSTHCCYYCSSHACLAGGGGR